MILIVDLVPQVADINVNDIGIADIVISPYLIHQLVACDRFPLVLHQIAKRIELLPGQCNRLTLYMDLPAACIDGNASGPKALFFLPIGSCITRTVLFQGNADPRKQFLDGERFGHIIIRSHIQTHYLVAHIILCGQHDDRHVTGMAKPAAHFDPAQFRQHQVEDQQVRILIQRGIQTASSVKRCQDFISFMLQLQFQKTRYLFLIFNDQYPGHDLLLHSADDAQRQEMRTASPAVRIIYPTVTEEDPSRSSLISTFPSVVSA